MRGLIFAFLIAGVQPLNAATFEIPLTFNGEYFQDVFDYENGAVGTVYDGALYGFTGTLSGLAPGEATEAVIEADELPDGRLSITSCYFAGLDCTGEFAELSADGMTLSILDLAGPSYTFDFGEGIATYYEDGPGGKSDTGFYNFYGAEFSMSLTSGQERLAEVPTPHAAAMLLSAIALFGLMRRRRKI